MVFFWINWVSSLLYYSNYSIDIFDHFRFSQIIISFNGANIVEDTKEVKVHFVSPHILFVVYQCLIKNFGLIILNLFDKIDKIVLCFIFKFSQILFIIINILLIKQVIHNSNRFSNFFPLFGLLMLVFLAFLTY